MTDFRSFLQLVDEEEDELDTDKKKNPELDEDGNPVDPADDLDEDDDEDEKEGEEF